MTELTLSTFSMKTDAAGKVAGLPLGVLRPGIQRDGNGRKTHKWNPQHDENPTSLYAQHVSTHSSVVDPEMIIIEEGPDYEMTDEECLTAMREHFDRCFSGPLKRDEDGSTYMYTKVEADGSAKTFPIRCRHRFVELFDELVRGYQPRTSVDE